jgi:dihydrofolate synthase/folylpolyglutamate synthase
VIDVFTPYASYTDLFLPLHGAYQADNAVAALTAVECFLDRPLGYDLVADALASVESPGRLEVVGHDPLVVIDGTKNVAGARAVRAALDEEFPRTERTWVIGVLRQKDAGEMLEALGVSESDRVVCCRPDLPRARDPQEVADAALALGVPGDRIEVIDRVADAVRHAIAQSPPEGQVIVAGSLYVAGPARTALVR